MRTFLGWIAGIAATCAVILVLNAGMEWLGIPTYVDFGETVTVTHGGGRTSYDSEESGAGTAPGTAIQMLGVLLGIWLGRFVALGRGVALFDGETRAFGAAALVFLPLYGGGGALLLLLFRDFDGGLADGLFNLLQLALAVGAFLLARRRYWQVKENSTVDARPC